MLAALYLPKLNNLRPSLQSTLWKAVEEAGELSRAVLQFLPYENLAAAEIGRHSEAAELLSHVTEELLDVAQTCVTMIFVMEDYHNVKPDELIGDHLAKLTQKGYGYDSSHLYTIETTGNFKYLQLPRLAIEGVTLLTTVCKIQEELGELTQYLGKEAGASGEAARSSEAAVMRGCAEELLDVAQCCFTMMYILAERYAVDTDRLLACHVEKLRRKGYCA